MEPDEVAGLSESLKQLIIGEISLTVWRCQGGAVPDYLVADLNELAVRAMEIGARVVVRSPANAGAEAIVSSLDVEAIRSLLAEVAFADEGGAKQESRVKFLAVAAVVVARRAEVATDSRPNGDEYLRQRALAVGFLILGAVGGAPLAALAVGDPVVKELVKGAITAVLAAAAAEVHSYVAQRGSVPKPDRHTTVPATGASVAVTADRARMPKPHVPGAPPSPVPPSPMNPWRPDSGPPPGPGSGGL